jgi:hypothetical protein
MKIQEVITAINQMQADGIIARYAIGGAVGATFYLEPVATLDVDIFVAFRPEPGSILLSPAPIFNYLKSCGYSMEGEYIMIGGWPVQFLPPTGHLAEEALAKAVENDVEGTPARVFTAEHLAAIALGEKLRMLDALREREIAIRGRDPHAETAILREAPAPYRTKPQ